jgi:hypothetical protein
MAQDSDADAERLFREGQKLLEERRFGEACPKFEQAYRKDRQLGTLINLAFCHKEQGAIWYAWLEFKEAEVRATELNRPDRRDFARQRLAELEKLLPKVVVDNPRKMPLTQVLVEEKRVPEAERGAVFAAEEGNRKFIFRAKGKKPATQMVNVAKGERAQHVVVPEMEDAGPDDAPPPDHADAPSKPEVVGSDAAPDPNPGATQRTLGWVAIGAGGVALAIGSVTGLMAITAEDKTAASAHDAATVSTISFIVAGVGIGGGLVLLLTAAPSRSASATGAMRTRTVATQRAGLRITPELGAGWAGLSGRF